MCHHIDMDIDWKNAVTEQDTDTQAKTPDAEEPEFDAAESPQDIAPPADD